LIVISLDVASNIFKFVDSHKEVLRKDEDNWINGIVYILKFL